MNALVQKLLSPSATLISASILLLSALSLEAQTLDIQAGQFEVRGGFQVRRVQNIDIVAAGNGVHDAPAVGAIQIPHAGVWHLWVQSRSLPSEGVDARRFTLRLGQTTLAKLFGGHRLSANLEFIWEDGGKIDLPAGPLLMVIGETNTPNAQCGHILLTDETGDSPPALLLARAKPATVVPLTRSTQHATPEMAPVVNLTPAPAAVLANDHVRISFQAGSSADGKSALLQQIEVPSGPAWKRLVTTGGADSYRVVYRPLSSDPHLAFAAKQHPTWDTSYDLPVTLSAGGASARSNAGPDTAPWLAGRLFQVRPIGATQVDPQTVELSFAPLPIGTLTARWTLVAGQPSAAVKLSLALTSPGYVSLGYHGAVEEETANLDFLMLPYLYLGRRFPAEANTMPSDHTPTPAVLVTRQHLSYAVMAEPSAIPLAWPAPQQARFLLGIRNESGLAQPLIYAPLLGSEQSLHRGPATIDAQFRIWAQDADWMEAYRGIVTQSFGLRDYRVPVAASLSDTVLNLSSLMRNDDASGWSEHAKGSWNIESRNVVTQPSPLTYLSYALLTGDEAFYRKYALPSLEYLLSRPDAHMALNGGPPGGGYGDEDLPLGGPNRAFGCTVYASAYRMTLGATPAFAGYCFKPDKSIYSRGAHTSSFDDELELYETTGDAKWLSRAIADADRYIAENLTTIPSRDLGEEPFLNVTYTPEWESLLHVYEASHEPRFLKAAHDAAYWLMTTVWTQPAIPDAPVTVHPDKTLHEREEIWWKGDHFFRLGFIDEPAPPGAPRPKAPVIALPSATVPSWTVSQVGLGLEQPGTYSQAGNNNNIMMSVWAANLLRLGALSQDDLLRTYAHNATIGRFSNYPGYYVNLFTNLYQAPDYIFKGPDLTSFYFHHIAPFAAYIADYVFTDAEMRSHGGFAFPAARQLGYVWFDSRLRGFAPGKVYGEPAWPWVHPTAARTANKNVDLVLAHNQHTLYVALSNQTKLTQPVAIRLDASVLGAPLNGNTVRLWMDDKPQARRAIQDSTVHLNLPPAGFAVLAVDGLNIDVPAHQTAGADTVPLPSGSGLETKDIPGSSLSATGSFIIVPQFASREFYAYVRATEKQCGGATLVYRIGQGAEQRKTVDSFPCEFSVPLPFDKTPVDWHIEAIQPGKPPA